jgi:hypothetical protein
MKRSSLAAVAALMTILPAGAAMADDWVPNHFYSLGASATFNQILYDARQAHTSQVGWEPPNVPALWERPTPPNFSAWTTQTKYLLGSKVVFSGKAYEAITAHNSQPDWTPPLTPSLWKATAFPSFSTTQAAINALGVFGYNITSFENGKVVADLKGANGATVGKIDFAQPAITGDQRFPAGAPIFLGSVTWSGAKQTHDFACERTDGPDEFLDGFVDGSAYRFLVTDCQSENCNLDILPELTRSSIDRVKASSLLRSDLGRKITEAGLVLEVNAAAFSETNAWVSTYVLGLSHEECKEIVRECLMFCNRGPADPRVRAACYAACMSLYIPCRAIPGAQEQGVFESDARAVIGF